MSARPQYADPAEEVAAVDTPAAGRPSLSLALDPHLAGNPVARAYARAGRRASGERTSGAPGSALKGLLLWFVVVPGILFLVSNPVGWIVLLMLCLGFGYLIGFGGIL